MMNPDEVEVLRVVDFSETPGGRYRKQGKDSGEEFRETRLRPILEGTDKSVVVDLDDVFAYSGSFLEEVFGGIVRELGADVAKRIVIDAEDQEYRFEAHGYMMDAVQAERKGFIGWRSK